MLGLAPLVYKLIAVLVVLGLIGGVITWWSIHEYNAGYAAAIADIAAKDKGAVDAVNAAKAKVEECDRIGGNWSTVDGMCH
jgi:hypothetical protein